MVDCGSVEFIKNLFNLIISKKQGKIYVASSSIVSIIEDIDYTRVCIAGGKCYDIVSKSFIALIECIKKSQNTPQSQ
jgi:hypothetical protein